MLSDTQSEHRKFPFHDGSILVCRGIDVQLAAILNQPGPARSEPRGGGGAELFFEGRKAAEGAVDGGAQVSRRLATGLRPNDRPKHGVIDMAAAIVADGSPNSLGN